MPATRREPPRPRTLMPGVPVLGEAEFRWFQQMIFDVAGIHMTAAKRSMVAARLAKRLKALGLGSYGEYLRRLAQDHAERALVVDLLTTNETYFFREPKHFDFLREQILAAHPRGRPFRVWSAACSSGEEPYSLAMVLADRLGLSADWGVLGSDISNKVLERARAGQYPMSRAERIPPDYLKRYCLKGVGSNDGSFLIERTLQARVEFRWINLNERLPALREFDLILLRNVMIYFNADTKRQVVARIAEKLKPGGYLFIGHSESLNGIYDGLTLITPSIYRKPV